VKGTRLGAVTDVDGRFRVTLPDDNAVLVFTYIGYLKKEVKVDTHTGVLNIVLEQDTRSLSEVTVMARRKSDNEIALLNERKNAAVVSDAISARLIEKTASITTTQALQRVTGVTITDDKYVAIRGLGDRSVIAELNGVRLSSSNPDRSAAPLDLVPAALLDNVTVYKTLTPDRPADAAAGIVELKTKSVPDSLTVNFVAQAGFNSTIGLDGKFNAYRNYDPGFWGQNVKSHDLSQAFTDLNAQYPGGLRQIQKLFIDSRGSEALTAEANRVNKLMLGFDPIMTTSYQKATPNQVYAATVGNTFKIFHGHDLGVVVSANYYSRTEDRYHAQLNRYTITEGIVTGSNLVYNPLRIPPFSNPDALYLGKYLSFKENTGTQTINYGILGALTYRFDPRNEISAQYLASRGAEVQGRNLTGTFDNTGFDYTVYDQVNILLQRYRVFNTFNLQGEHKLLNKSWSPQLSYNLSTSHSFHNEPDYRFSDVVDAMKFKYLDQNGVGFGTHTYVFQVGRVHGLEGVESLVADPNGRRFRKLNEDNYNYKADLTQPFTLWGNKQSLKFGYNYLRRNRDFTEYEVGIPGRSTGDDNGLLQKVNGDLNVLVSSRYVGLRELEGSGEIGAPRIGGFLYQIRKRPNNYEGYYETQAFYGMLDTRITPELRLIGGVRFESTRIKVDIDTVGVVTEETDNTIPIPVPPSRQALNPHTNYKVTFEPYFSGNLVYTFRSNMNFRLAYQTSLARPELREIAGVYEFDPAQFAVIVGNRNLVNQHAQAADFRWEWFPAAGEVLAASLFGKRITKQLTKTFSYSSQGNLAQNPEFPIIHFENDPEPGTVYGIELEVRKSLGTVWEPLRNFFLGTNLMLANSVIKKNAARLDASRTIDRYASDKSPMFEQAPYSLNAYLDYDNAKSGTNVTLSFNQVGERLVQVQLDGTPDLYDQPVSVLDFVFSQRVKKIFVIKGFAKNILNPAYQIMYTTAGNKGTYRGHNYIYQQYYRGTEYSLGLVFNLF
jgi:TonB-dependent receptor